VSYRIEDCLPLAVVVRNGSDVSRTIDMDAAVRDTKYALSEEQKN
jgi:hypothetical protein